ncbi:MAG: hypothetical protein V4667_00235 [Bacteroidota bacterium]
MTARRIKIIFYLIIGLCVFTMVLPSILFNFIELDIAVNWTMKYFSIPILLINMPICYFVYIKFLKQHETKQHKSIKKIKLRSTFRIFFMTIGMSVILIGTTLSLIILTNAYLGNTKTIILNAKIIDYYTFKNKGKTNHYIKIQDSQLNRIVELRVKKQYQIGDKFNKTVQQGKWGLLFSND